MKQYRVLIVEDEPLTCNVYQLILQELSEDSKELRFDSDVYHNFEPALTAIETSATGHQWYALAILDLRLVSIDGDTAMYGKELGISLRRYSPETKIVIITSIKDNYCFYTLLRNINPEGFLIKGEMDFVLLKSYLHAILENNTAYSKTVVDFLRSEVCLGLPIDQIDRSILYYLSKGEKIKDLPNFLPLSLSGIEKRKKRLAELLDLNSNDVFSLIAAAKERGLL
ncbi:hypothetical protein [Spongiimicrobium sp. 3-5]|uniref:hypothetical protein n=1 Tax=Spongiimicrobium sp. 3-5 TaxID=3332596 RepID=UPI00398124FC